VSQTDDCAVDEIQLVHKELVENYLKNMINGLGVRMGSSIIACLLLTPPEAQHFYK
jgi:Na+-translocating ferredoxin:NAD+ oxidoreductase RnfA subunit